MLIDLSTEGLLFPLTIDGSMIYEAEDADVFPATFQPIPRPIQDFVDTIDGGSQAFQPGFGTGHCDFSTRMLFNIVFNSISGPMKILMAKIMSKGMQHSLTYWKPDVASYTASAPISKFYLPHYRRDAPQVFPDLIYRGIQTSTTNFGATATVNDVALTVDYQDGPTLVTPAAGHIAIAKFPEASGHVPMVVGTAINKGDVLEVVYFPVFYVTLLEFSPEFPAVNQEKHTYKFQER